MDIHHLYELAHVFDISSVSEATTRNYMYAEKWRNVKGRLTYASNVSGERHRLSDYICSG